MHEKKAPTADNTIPTMLPVLSPVFLLNGFLVVSGNMKIYMIVKWDKIISNKI